MSEAAIAERLIQMSREVPRVSEYYDEGTGNPEADAFVDNLNEFPHAFVIACLMDRQGDWKRAWQVPYKISQKLGEFSIITLSRLSLEHITELMSQPEKLVFRFNVMSEVLYSAIQRINDEYGGDASRIWTGKPPSAEVVYRFLQFKGAGPKIATMATNILARNYKIEFSDYYSVDISVDVHVFRVFEHLGLCRHQASNDEVIYKARALYPEYPGILDLPCWTIGHNWCTELNKKCGLCYMRHLCPSASSAN
jgi:endonuclease III